MLYASYIIIIVIILIILIANYFTDMFHICMIQWNNNKYEYEYEYPYRMSR